MAYNDVDDGEDDDGPVAPQVAVRDECAQQGEDVAGPRPVGDLRAAGTCCHGSKTQSCQLKACAPHRCFNLQRQLSPRCLQVITRMWLRMP